ncbi:MAG: glycoside hydrolase family 2 protein [Armatimonadota bacterium]
MKLSVLVIAIAASVLASSGCAIARDTLSLSGKWDFRMDPKDVGVTEQWYNPGAAYDKSINVPGAWNAQGMGEAAEKIFHDFPGPAWYRRKVTIPENWIGKTVWLCFGGVHRYADVWVNGKKVGSHIGYLTPFRFNVSDYLQGRTADIVARVDARQNNELDPLKGCFDVIDEVFISWGGLYRGVQMEATARTWIKDIFVVPHVDSGTAEIKIELNGDGMGLKAIADVSEWKGKSAGRGEADFKQGSAELTIPVKIAHAKLWTPKEPNLYTVKMRLVDAGGRELDSSSDRFGLRELKVRGSQFLLNGKPIFLRGYGDDCIYPNTVAPPADKKEYYHRFKIAKEYGFNFVRHHSWFPLDEYFDVADELGIMLQPEFPIAYRPFYDAATPAGKQLYIEQWESIIKARRNHPSIVSWSMSNEEWDGFDLAPRMYKIAKEIDPTRLVIDSDGVWGTTLNQKTRDTLDYLVGQFPEWEMLGFNDGKYDLPTPKPAKPVIVHEMSNFGTLPDLSQIELFSDGIRPWWLYKARDLVAKAGLADVYPQWVANSMKLQALALKCNIEAARRSQGVMGYNQWLLQDYWNGSNGVLDMFYRRKGSTAAEFRKFNSPTVLLMDCARRNYWRGETAKITLFVSRYEDDPSNDAVLHWELRVGKRVLRSGSQDSILITSDGLQELASLSIEMPKVDKAAKLTLVAEITDRNGKSTNDWNFWVFPEDRLSPGARQLAIIDCRPLDKLYPTATKLDSASDLSNYELVVASRLEAGTVDYLEKGGRVLLVSPKQVFPSLPSKFKPCWWVGDAAWDNNTGTVIQTAHPAVAAVPNDGWCDLQFNCLVNKSLAAVLDDLPVLVDPIVRCLDVHGALRNKAYLFEVAVGRGRLLVSGFNFADAVNTNDPAIYFLDQLIRYALGPNFAPKAAILAGYLRASAIPRVNGFARLVSCTSPETMTQNYRDASRRCWRIRPADADSRIEWESAPVTSGQSGRVKLVWTVTLDCPDDSTGKFTIFLNSEPVVDFDCDHRRTKWTSADGQVELGFEPRTGGWRNASGVMSLTVPSGMLTEGAPATLALVGAASNAPRSVTVFDYQDTVAYENEHWW